MHPLHPMMTGNGWLGFWTILSALIGLATLVLLVVAIIRLWPRRPRPRTFQASEPGADERERPRRDPPPDQG